MSDDLIERLRARSQWYAEAADALAARAATHKAVRSEEVRAVVAKLRKYSVGCLESDGSGTYTGWALACREGSKLLERQQRALEEAHEVRDRCHALHMEAIAERDALTAKLAEMEQLLQDMRPYWGQYTEKRIWTADVAGLMASIRTRMNAALATADKEGKG